MPEWHQSDYD